MNTTLRHWKDAFAVLDRCPWAGPRPLTDSDEDYKRFVGREADARDFKSLVLKPDHRLVVLTGESGVGKSSFLNARLLQAFGAAGLHPFICRNWRWSSDEGSDVDGLIRSQMGSGWNARTRNRVEGSLCDQLDAHYGGSAVLIFDQFEELIRYQPNLFSRVAEWILNANHQNRIRIVLSLRLEYRHRLRPIEQDASPFSITNFVLEPLIDSATIRRIISSSEAGTESAIEPDAAELLLDQWQTVGKRSSAGWNDLNLLQLQATLYALHAEALAHPTPGVVDGYRIAVGHVKRFTQRADTEPVKSLNSTPTIFQLGLREALRLKLERCLDACRHPSLPRPLDKTLVEGTNAIAHRLIPHLSSGGFKLEREEWELAHITLWRELDRLTRSSNPGDQRPTSSEIEYVFRDLSSRSRSSRRAEMETRDLLCVSRSRVARTLGLRWSTSKPAKRLKANGVDVAPWEVDPYDVGSGPLLGMPASVVLIEELRRLVFALHWLETAQLVRASSPAPGKTMLSLIHDGFASALEDRASFAQSGPEGALSLLSAAKGETYHWRRVEEPDRPLDEFGGSKHKVTFANLRWRDCQVSASFQGVVFVNCDFRGTRFRECRFRGVVFVNCLLDGVSFEECTILGRASDPPPIARRSAGVAERSKNPLLIDTKRLPAFRIPVSADALSELRWYRELPSATTDDGGHTFLYSRTSGVAAVPWQPSYGLGLPWKRETGGLTMYGGRLSSLMMQRCTFDDGGSLALRHITGSALDIVEQAGGGRIEIAFSTIRGFTITRPVDDLSMRNDHRALDIEVLDSFMTNVWFGDGLRGKATFKFCKLWQVCNISDRKKFDVAVLDDSPQYGLVNASVPDLKSKKMPSDFASDPSARADFARDVIGMDYRSVPARLELTKPKRLPGVFRARQSGAQESPSAQKRHGRSARTS